MEREDLPGLKSYLGEYGIDYPSTAADLVVEEALRVARIKQFVESEDGYRPALPEVGPSELDPEANGARLRAESMAVGVSLGRVLARVEDLGRDRHRFRRQVFERLSPGLTVNFDDAPEAYALVAAQEIAFHRGVTRGLKEGGSEASAPAEEEKGEPRIPQDG